MKAPIQKHQPKPGARMKFFALIILSFSFTALAYNSPTTGNRPEKIEETAWEKRTPASVNIPQEIKKNEKAEKK